MPVPEIVLNLTDGETEWKVGIVGRVIVNEAEQTVTLPDPDDPAEPIVLTDFLLVEFAREGMNGLRIISEQPVAGAGTEPAQS